MKQSKVNLSEYIGEVSNEDSAALTVQWLNNRYPNVYFEGTETGTGKYKITVSSKYNRHITAKTITQWINEFNVLYSAMPELKKILKGRS